MKNKISNNVDIGQFAEYLLGKHPQADWKTVVLENLKLVNLINPKKLKVKEIKTIFRETAKKAKSITKPTASKDYSKQVFTMAQILNWKGGNEKWVIKDLLPQNGIAILSGSPASFKTWSTLHYAICIAEGLPVYGHFETIKQNVLIIDEEDGVGLLQQRAKILSANEKVSVIFKVMSGFKIDQEESIDDLLRLIKRKNIKVVVVDSLVRIHNGDENSSNDMKKVFEQFRILNRLGVTILINHHHGKNGENNNSDSMRGSSDILASVDCQMKIRREDSQLVITQKKNRISQELKPFKVDVVTNDEKMTFAYCGDDSENMNKLSKNKALILSILSEGGNKMSRVEIDEAVGGKIGESKVQSTLATLTENGTVKFETLAKGKLLYWVESKDKTVD